MKLLGHVVPALLAASGVVRAAAIAPRADDPFFSGFLDLLNENNMSRMADGFKRIADTDEGKPVIELLKSKQLTILAPEDKEYELFPHIYGLDELQFSIVIQKMSEIFGTKGHSRRGAKFQSRSPAPSSFKRSSAPNRKAAESLEDNQVQVMDLYDDSSIAINRPVGNAQVTGMFQYNQQLDILRIDNQLELPPNVSDLLCKPLTEDDTFTKFTAALQRTGLMESVDKNDKLTLFVPVDKSSYDWDERSEEDLKSTLQDHFLFGQVLYSTKFLSVGEVTALSGKQLKLSVEDGVSYVSCGTSKAKLLRSDVISSNGGLHVIDSPIQCN
ncbi:FAS1 domain-containing protein [Rhizoctonia solani]|nr:FAS1 domain-containing protein [Rhizoctonia solani]